MQFPVPSEVFASNDIKTLQRKGINLSVHNLKGTCSNYQQLIKERQLSDIRITNCNLLNYLRGIRLVFRRPVLAGKLVYLVLKFCWSKPIHFIKSLILGPRILYLIEEIKHSPPDVVHLFWGHYPSLVGLLIKGEMPEVKLSIFIGAYDLTEQYGLTGPAAKTADLVLTHARVNVESIKELGISEEKIKVVYRGMDLKIVPEEMRKEPKKVITISRFIKSKAVEDALKAFAEITSKYEQTTMIVVGDGKEKKRLISLTTKLGIKDRVTFMGHLPHDEVIMQLSKAEVFLFMSKKESERLPNVVKEAMACRCYCVVTKTPGMEELLKDGFHGAIVPIGDYQAAAEKVNEAFYNPDMTLQRIEAALSHIKANFDLEQQMSYYLAYWQQLLIKPGGSCSGSI